MAEATKDTNAVPSNAPAAPTPAAQEQALNPDGTPKAITVAEPAAGSPDAIKAQEEADKAAQKASDEAVKASGGGGAEGEQPQVMHMHIVQNAPYTGTVAGATDTVKGGKYMVGGKLVDANGVPLREQGDKAPA